jgi:hypothetical protein
MKVKRIKKIRVGTDGVLEGMVEKPECPNQILKSGLVSIPD